MSKKKVIKTTSEKITCSCCGKDKDSTKDFYTSFSHFHSHTGRMHVCKQCVQDSVKENDAESFMDMLRKFDKPFITHLYESAIQNNAFVGEYFKLVNAKDFRHMTWNDSDFEGHKNSKVITQNSSPSNIVKYEDYSSLRKKWGVFEDNEYEYLENFYGEYENSYATDTPVQINLYKNIAKVHLQAEKELANGQTKNFKDLMELSSKLHNDGNIKPIQSSGANDDKGLSTYGLWIKIVEQDEPCEYFENKPIYEDYDKFKKYIDKWFVRPFKNIFNISKDFDVKDDN
jgi:hypothetical protein